MSEIKKVLLVRSGESFTMDVTPPQGPLYLAAMLRRDLEAEVGVLDLMLHAANDEQVAQYAAAFQPDLIGWSGMLFQADAVLRLAGKVREKLPQVVQVIGGPFPSADPQRALSTPAVDYAVCGEGERTLVELIRALNDGGDAHDVPGLAWRDNGGIAFSPPREPIADLDSLPFPAFDLADFDAYSRLPHQGFLYKRRRYFTLLTSRGCPYGCIFCHHLFGRRYHPRSPDNVLAEIDLLYHQYDVRELQVLDDSFNLQRGRTLDILQGIVRRKYRLALSFTDGLRGDLLDEEVIDWLKRAGTYKVAVAIESANPHVQKEIEKNVDLEKVRRAIELLAAKRILTNGFFMMGLPGETLADLRRTAEFARASRLHSASFFFPVPFPGSKLYEIYRQTRREEPDLSFPSSYYDPRMTHLSLADAKPEQIAREARLALRRFYLNPLRLWRIWRVIPRKRQVLSLLPLVTARAVFPWLLRRERDHLRLVKKKGLPAAT